jgi:hypothetical protein
LVLNQIPQHVLAPVEAHPDRVAEFLSPYWDASFYNGIAALGEGQDGGMRLSMALQNFERDTKKSSGKSIIYVVFLRYNSKRAKSVLETPISRGKGKKALSQRKGSTYRSQSQMPMQSIEEGDVVDLTSDNGKDWRQIKDFQDLPVADELLNLRKARASSKASIEPRAWTESRSPTVSKTPTASKLLQSKQRATEQQEEVEEDENTRTPTPATRELPRLKLTLSLKKDRRVVRVTS